ncbi:hypothetical protein ACOME3_004109 [Neoechinorhynchus agilis]
MKCSGKCSSDFENNTLIVYRSIDKDNIGTIDRNKLDFGLRELGLDLSELDTSQIFCCIIDRIEDGKVSFDEFKKVARVAKAESGYHEHYSIKDVFRKLDTDNSKQLDFQDVIKGLKMMNRFFDEEKSRHWFEIMDVDNDRLIGFFEFSRIVHIAKVI